MRSEKNIRPDLVIILVLLALVYVPLITYIKLVPFISPVIDPILAYPTGNRYELYTYYKFWLLVLISSMLLIRYMLDLASNKKHLYISKMDILLLIFSLSLLLSALFSDYKTIALFGMYNRHMGAIAFLCFALFVFIISKYFDSVDKIKLVPYALMPFLLVNALLVLLGYIGYNVLTINFFYC